MGHLGCGYGTAIVLVYMVGDHWHVWEYPNDTPGAAPQSKASLLRLITWILGGVVWAWASVVALVCHYATRRRPASRAGAASLSSLPPELLEIVGEHLSSADTCALRLVCPQLAHTVLTTTFTRVHFAKRSCLMYSLASLETLLYIAQHPVFGPTLQELTFFVDTVSRPPPERPGWIRSYLMGSDPEREYRQSIYQDHQKLDVQVTTLWAVFQWLQGCGQLRKIHISSNKTADVKQNCDDLAVQHDNTVGALHRLEVALGILPAKFFRTLSTLVMEGNNVSVRTLDLHERRSEVLGHSLPDRSIFEHFRSISLTLHTTDVNYDVGVEHLLKTLSRNQFLENLTLHFKLLDGANKLTRHGRLYAGPLMRTKFYSLRSLTLGCFRINLTELIKFTIRNPMVEKFTLAEDVAIGIPQEDFDAWKIAVDSGADALTLVKDAVEIDELEDRLLRNSWRA